MMSRIEVAHVATVDMSIRYLLMNQLFSLQRAGYRVTAVSSYGPSVPAVEAAGINHVSVRMSRSALTPHQIWCLSSGCIVYFDVVGFRSFTRILQRPDCSANWQRS